MFQDNRQEARHIALLDRAIPEVFALSFGEAEQSWDQFYTQVEPLMDWQTGSRANKTKNLALTKAAFRRVLSFLIPNSNGWASSIAIAAFAIKKNKIGILEYAIQCLGLDLNAEVGPQNQTLLGIAIEAKHPEVVRYLLSYTGIDLKKPTSIYKAGPFEYALDRGNDLIASLLVKDPRFILPDGFTFHFVYSKTPLSVALEKNLIETATHLLQRKDIKIDSNALRIVSLRNHPLLQMTLNHPNAQNLGDYVFNEALLTAMQHRNDEAMKLILSRPTLSSKCLLDAIHKRIPSDMIDLLLKDLRIDLSEKRVFQILEFGLFVPKAMTAIEYVSYEADMHEMYESRSYYWPIRPLLKQAHIKLFYQEACVSADTALKNLKEKHKGAEITVDTLKKYILDKVKSDDPETNISNMRAEMEFLNNSISALSAFFGSQRKPFIKELEAKISQIQEEQTALILLNLQGTSSSLIFSTSATSEYYRAPRIDSIEKENILLEIDRVGFFQKFTEKTKKQEKLLHTAEMRGMTNNRL